MASPFNNETPLNHGVSQHVLPAMHFPGHVQPPAQIYSQAVSPVYGGIGGTPYTEEYGMFPPMGVEKVNLSQGPMSATVAQAKEKSSDPWRSQKRLHVSDALMSKLACTLLSNMLAWGVKAMTPRNHERNKSIGALIDTLNDDAEFKAMLNGMELKQSSVKKWIDEDGPKFET
jgi:hypothetical protein